MGANPFFMRECSLMIIIDGMARSGYISRRKSNSCRHCEEPRRGDAAIFFYKNEIASPAARNDIIAKEVMDTYETASILPMGQAA